MVFAVFLSECESDCDVFGTGHSSTSISAALGLAVARDLEQNEETIAVVIGEWRFIWWNGLRSPE